MNKKSYFRAGILLLVGLAALQGWAVDYGVGKGLVKESAQLSEIVTYGSFKAGAYRDIYDVPVNFGSLITITATPGGGAIFWFQDDRGNLRNAEIEDVSKPLVIRRAGTVTVVQ